ncbi:TetR/AcrR family transcriptional regulator [Paraferrimonas haliotis]|uniref:HTH tetR-type domain-containing protein n=1 Tax=Paraferrimonas haliotis TaxID=2013866 RepID=A0AA37TMN1_9GAMM|nr:TetR/AcrR family transcriptional regulator [Paraferrimonas haliotis]GLS84419.1 hypothetical protein GCM10007894_23960 [Paraferrimonas haliotis]
MEATYDRQAELLGVARELILEQGINGFKLIDIAKKIDIPRSQLYAHFRSREDVLVCIVIEDLKSVRDIVIELVNDDTLSHLERLMILQLGPIYKALESNGKAGTQFIMSNQSILNAVSQETRDSVAMAFNNLMNSVHQIWMGAVYENKISASEHKILEVKRLLSIFQRGSVIMALHKAPETLMLPVEFDFCFDYVNKTLMELGWEGEPSCRQSVIEARLNQFFKHPF